jgi:hypothetical protein
MQFSRVRLWSQVPLASYVSLKHCFTFTYLENRKTVLIFTIEDFVVVVRIKLVHRKHSINISPFK